MRITSGMMTNNMMLNVNRSMRNLDHMWHQFSSGRRIHVPSDNPLVAARAMKFRTNLVQNEDFRNNVDNGLAWMDVTEAAIDGVVQVLMLEARDAINRAHNNYLDLNDRDAIVNYLRHVLEQIGHHMNTQFAGRYIFSGLRTDEPPVFTQNNDRSFRITQNFTLQDMEQTKSLQIFPLVPGGETQMPLTRDIHILKLAYRHIDLDANGVPQLEVPGFQIRMMSKNDPEAYFVRRPGDPAYPGPPPLPAMPGAFPGDLPIVHYIPETGELVFHIDDVTGARGAELFPRGQGINITYTKTGFRAGELNPMVYFDTTQKLTRFDELEFLRFAEGNRLPPLGTPPAFVMGAGSFVGFSPFTITEILSAMNGVVRLEYADIDPAVGTFAFEPTDVDIDGTTYALTPVPNAVSPADRNALANGVVHINTETGTLYMNDDTAAAFRNVRFTYEKTNFNATDIIPTANPNVSASLYRTEPPAVAPVPFRLEGFTYDMNNQSLIYEFSTRTTVPVNALAKNIFTDKLYADLLRLIEFVENTQPTERALIRAFYEEQGLTGLDLDNAVLRHESDERAFINYAMNDRFNNMLFLIDRHATVARREYTDIGSRGRRLELFQNRLEQDEGSLYRLMSNNENVDMARVTTLMASAEAMYLAAIRVGTNIINVTLANFLQV